MSISPRSLLAVGKKGVFPRAFRPFKVTFIENLKSYFSFIIGVLYSVLFHMLRGCTVPYRRFEYTRAAYSTYLQFITVHKYILHAQYNVEMLYTMQRCSI